MRTLSLQESQFISGGVDQIEFGNAFLSGMKGEQFEYSMDVAGWGIIFGVSGLIIGAKISAEAAFAGVLIGFPFGALLGAGIAYNQYLLGRNYMEAQQLIKSA